MNNLKFTAIAGAVAAASLGVAASHYQSVSVVPFVVVYHDSALKPGQASRSSGNFWTLAVRADGANMRVNRVPDSAGQIQGVRSLEFTDRYVVVDPHTTSTSTYKPYRPIIVGAQSCSGRPAVSILDHPIEYVQENKPSKARQLSVERWLATDLNCLPLREHTTMTEKDGTETQFFREAVSIKLGEPPAEYFEIPSNYVERGPADINSEVEKRFPGSHVIPHPEMRDKLQSVYEADKPPK
jgi:hypothetical protein